jgi:hypothetical protein
MLKYIPGIQTLVGNSQMLPLDEIVSSRYDVRTFAKNKDYGQSVIPLSLPCRLLAAIPSSVSATPSFAELFFGYLASIAVEFLH